MRLVMTPSSQPGYGVYHLNSHNQALGSSSQPGTIITTRLVMTPSSQPGTIITTRLVYSNDTQYIENIVKMRDYSTLAK